jgi:hypothetical protein
MYNLHLTLSPNDIVRQARLKNPDLQRWIDALVPESRTSSFSPSYFVGLDKI